VDVVMAAAEAGVTMVQYRDKSCDMATISANVAMLAEMLKPYKIPLLVNDYVDVAVAASADGVHLGQGDVCPKEARAKLGFDAPTKTDKGKPVLGIEQFSVLAAISSVPVVGIGGVTADNAVPVIEAGADGVAMMRSISEADDVEAAVRAFLMQLKAAA